MSTRRILAKPLEDVEDKYRFVNEEQLARQRLEAKGKGAKNTRRTNRTVEISDSIKLPGKRFCDCQGTEHDAWTNCLNCGRIACSQEGSGPCRFCGELSFSSMFSVYTLDEEQCLRKGDQKARELLNELMPNAKVFPTISSVTEDLQKALENKDKLLEYQRESAKRTTAVDDQGEWYDMSTPWLSKEQKSELQQRCEELLNKKYSSRYQKPIMLKFNGEEVVEEKDFIDLFASNVQIEENRCLPAFTEPGRNPSVAVYKPEFVETQNTPQMQNTPAIRKCINTVERSVPRIQASEADTMQDEGKCLSMHQPYASLLIRGIKRYEGRNWYTAHRGTLWIASTKKVPSNEDVTSIENFYTVLYNSDLPRPFPPEYSTGCLLGCVEVEDCLSQEDYRIMYPDGESEAPYVLICKNARELPLKFPILGRQKIYKLDPKIHEAARNAIGMEFMID